MRDGRRNVRRGLLAHLVDLVELVRIAVPVDGVDRDARRAHLLTAFRGQRLDPSTLRDEVELPRLASPLFTIPALGEPPREPVVVLARVAREDPRAGRSRAILDHVEHGPELRVGALGGQDLETDAPVALLHLIPRRVLVAREADGGAVTEDDEALVGPGGVVGGPPVSPRRGVLGLVRARRGRDVSRERRVVERRGPERKAATTQRDRRIGDRGHVGSVCAGQGGNTLSGMRVLSRWIHSDAEG